jgi:NADP-dependent 3-hydroxy acid dehydrogenase YdfG
MRRADIVLWFPHLNAASSLPRNRSMTSKTNDSVRPFAVVTGASTGIGYELAKLCASNGFDLILAADEPLEEAAAAMRQLRIAVETV